MDMFDYSQEYNDVRYSCQDCGNDWNSKEFLEAFKDNYDSYSGYVKGDWHKIKRAIFENLFRPGNSQKISTVCPQCCAVYERKSGNISTTVKGTKNNREALKQFHEEDPQTFERAMAKIGIHGLEVNSQGRVVKE